MKRISITPRPHWKTLVEQGGLNFHTNADGTEYWKEDVCYEITREEQRKIQDAIKDLHKMCLQAVDKIASNEMLLNALKLPPPMQKLIKASWNGIHRNRYVYGRFDLIFDTRSGQVKLLEYNADTPTSLLEAGCIQKDWANHLQKNQFNELAVMIVDR